MLKFWRLNGRGGFVFKFFLFLTVHCNIYICCGGISLWWNRLILLMDKANAFCWSSVDSHNRLGWRKIPFIYLVKLNISTHSIYYFGNFFLKTAWKKPHWTEKEESMPSLPSAALPVGSVNELRTPNASTLSSLYLKLYFRVKFYNSTVSAQGYICSQLMAYLMDKISQHKKI